MAFHSRWRWRCGAAAQRAAWREVGVGLAWVQLTWLGGVASLSYLSNFVRRFAQPKAIEGLFRSRGSNRAAAVLQTCKICAKGEGINTLAARLPRSLGSGPSAPFPFMKMNRHSPHRKHKQLRWYSMVKSTDHVVFRLLGRRPSEPSSCLMTSSTLTNASGSIEAGPCSPA